MDGKIDFILCEDGGCWYIESLNVPPEIATQPDHVMVQWAKTEAFKDEPDIVFIGVYWRDNALDESGFTTDSIISHTYKKLAQRNSNAGN